MNRSLNFFFWTVWSSEALAAGTPASTPGMARNAWRGRGDGYDHEALAERPKRKSEGAAHRCAAPFPGPAAPGMAGHVPLSEWSRSGSGGSVSRRRAVASVARRSLPGSGNWFPARGAQRAVVVLWPPEAPARGTSAGMKNPDRLEERSGFVRMSPANGLFIGFAAMADTEDLDGDHLVSQ